MTKGPRNPLKQRVSWPSSLWGKKRMSDTSEQVCRHCQKAKPATLEYYRAEAKADNGLRKTCKVCAQQKDRNQKRAKVRASKPSSLIVLSDVHVPEHDRKVWATSLEIIRDVQPDEIVLLGDFLEMSSVSQHGGAELEKLTEDFDAGKQALKQLREAAGDDCRITYLEGNHESRLTRFLMSKAPSLRDSLSYEIGLGLAGLNIEWVPEYKQPITRGDLDLTHGHQDLSHFG